MNELATRLAEVEKEIELGAEQAKRGFEEVRDKALYREKYANFGDYCQRRWGMSVSQGYRIALRDEVRAEVSQICEKPSLLPNEGQARVLADVPKGERALTWQEVVATAPTKKNGTPKVTAKHVQKVVAKRKEPAPAAEPTDTTPSPKLDPKPWEQHNADAQRVLAMMDEYVSLVEGMAATPFGEWITVKDHRNFAKQTKTLFEKQQVVGFKPQWDIGKDGRNFFYAYEKGGKK
jgi:hypothetical protein